MIDEDYGLHQRAECRYRAMDLDNGRRSATLRGEKPEQVRARVTVAVSGGHNASELRRFRYKESAGSAVKVIYTAGGPRAIGRQHDTGAASSLSVRRCSNSGSMAVGATTVTGSETH